MRILLKPLFEIITGDIAVCGSVIYNYIIMFILGEIAFRLAFKLVGDLYHSGIIGSRSIGSLLHWLFRLIIYVCIAYILRGIIWLYYFIKGVPLWVRFSILGGIISLIILIIVMKLKKKVVKQVIDNQKKVAEDIL